MFGSKQTSGSVRGVETLIARNTAIEGKVKFTGVLTVEGVVVGDIVCTDGNDSVVRITSDGKVRGEIRSPDVIINGHVQGDVYAAGQLVLASDAVVDGNVHYNLIEMEKGAQINGAMVHSSASEVSAVSEAPTKLGKRVKPETDAAPKELAVS